MTMRLVVGFFVMMLVAAPVQAIDGAGKYTVFGNLSCGEWIKERKTEYSHTGVMMTGWVSGYVTALNRWMEGKENWLEGSDIDSAMLWIDKYCRENPLSNSHSAMRELMRELGVRR